jgi:hypothetical protein
MFENTDLPTSIAFQNVISYQVIAVFFFFENSQVLILFRMSVLSLIFVVILPFKLQNTYEAVMFHIFLNFVTFRTCVRMQNFVISKVGRSSIFSKLF